MILQEMIKSLFKLDLCSSMQTIKDRIEQYIKQYYQK